jgi:hypothetical protein
VEEIHQEQRQQWLKKQQLRQQGRLWKQQLKLQQLQREKSKMWRQLRLSMHHLQPLQQLEGMPYFKIHAWPKLTVASLITHLGFSRNLCRDLQVANVVDETASASVDPPPKKMTRRKKQLATKVRKSPAKKGKNESTIKDKFILVAKAQKLSLLCN